MDSATPARGWTNVSGIAARYPIVARLQRRVSRSMKSGASLWTFRRAGGFDFDDQQRQRDREYRIRKAFEPLQAAFCTMRSGHRHISLERR
jgi:hypothetical protein